jgi:tryptophanyl-tRNA synthetase
MDDKNYLQTVLKNGQNKAETVANETLLRVKDALGFLPKF